MTQEFVGRARISALGRLLAVLLGAVAVAVVVVGVTQGDPVGIAIGAFLLVVGVVFVAMCRVDTYVGEHDVTVRMPPFPARRYEFADIDAAVATPEGSGFRGLGYRWFGAGSTAYLSGGPEVRLRLRDGSRFVFSCPAARDVVTRIETAQGG